MNKRYEIVTNVIENNNENNEQTMHYVVQQYDWDKLPANLAEKLWVYGLFDEVSKYALNNKFWISTSTLLNSRVEKLLGSALEYTGGKYRSNELCNGNSKMSTLLSLLSEDVKKTSVNIDEFKLVEELRKKHPNTSYYNLFKKILEEDCKKVG